MIHRSTLLSHLDTLLDSARFHDYGPNGLQVEGRANIQTLVCGVTASRRLIEAALDLQADALLVHHGLFWRGQSGAITGWMKQRLALLLANDLNLLAYHIPLDAHPTLGNNAGLALALQWHIEGRFGEQEVGFIGTPTLGPYPNLAALSAALNQALGRSGTVVAPEGLQLETPHPIARIAWCSGGAQGLFEAAIAAGAQAFITGEISEPQAHLARETGVAFLAFGHHATERLGVQLLGQALSLSFGLDTHFVDIANPA